MINDYNATAKNEDYSMVKNYEREKLISELMNLGGVNELEEDFCTLISEEYYNKRISDLLSSKYCFDDKNIIDFDRAKDINNVLSTDLDKLTRERLYLKEGKKDHIPYCVALKSYRGKNYGLICTYWR